MENLRVGDVVLVVEGNHKNRTGIVTGLIANGNVVIVNNPYNAMKFRIRTKNVKLYNRRKEGQA